MGLINRLKKLKIFQNLFNNIFLKIVNMFLKKHMELLIIVFFVEN